MSIEFKIGADPEFFLFDTVTEKHVSAFDMIPGTKHDPFKVEGGAVQVDGMALEFNIDPATSFKEFNGNINKVLGQLRGMVDPRFKFDFTPVVHFGKEYIDGQCDEAKALGCDPDFDAWKEGAINPKPDGSMGIRTASGHIHVGWTQDQDVSDKEHIQAGIMLSKQLDFYLGVPSLVWDQNSLRRSMYGNPGAFRPKRYGMEYRTLSNVWVDDIDLRRFVFEQSMTAATELIKGNRVYEHISNHAGMYFSHSNWHEIKEVMYSCVYPNQANFRLVEKEVNDLINTKPRQEAVEYNTLMTEGYFYNRKTHELRSWDEVSSDDYNNGGWYNTNAYFRTYKAEGRDKPVIDPNTMKPVKNKKDGVIEIMPGQVYYKDVVMDHKKIMDDFINAGPAWGAAPKNIQWAKLKKPAPFPGEPQPLLDIAFDEDI